MPWDSEQERNSDGTTRVISYHTSEPEKTYHVFTIDHEHEIIEFLPKKEDNFSVEKIVLEGFHFIPPEFSETGYLKSGLGYYLDKKLREAKVSELTISRAQPYSLEPIQNTERFKMVLNYQGLVRLRRFLNFFAWESKTRRSRFVDGFFFEKFPKTFTAPNNDYKISLAARLIHYLDPEIVHRLKSDEVEKLLAIVEKAVKESAKKDKKSSEIIGATKIKVDEIALSEVIDRFKILLSSNTSESAWGEFLAENLFLIESKYVTIIRELNVVSAGARNVDFGLIDSQGYLDLFEIKKPTMKLLSRTMDRGNYYWSTSAVQALVQAEKYLFNAESRRSVLTDDIERQIGIQVGIVRPRAIVLMGNAVELTTKSMRDDFQILRRSLKNIEIILYDELLQQLENQMKKVVVRVNSESI